MSAFLTFAIRAMLDSGGAGYGHLGRIDVAATATLAAQLRTSADDLTLVNRGSTSVAIDATYQFGERDAICECGRNLIPPRGDVP